MIKRLIKDNIGYYLSKNEYYNSVATENGFLNKIASSLFIQQENTVETSHRILFNNKLSINSSKNEVINQLGKYNYYLEKSKSRDHSILFYKKLIGNLRARFELHLIEGELILGFATFDVPNTLNKLKIVKALTEKYEVSFQDIDLDQLRIEDQFNNYIQVIDSVNLTLAYGNKSKANNQLIYNIANEKEEVKRSIQEKENIRLQNNL